MDATHKRHRPGKIDKLPERIQTKVMTLLNQGVSQRAITAELNALLVERGESLSRSSVNRFAKKMRENGLEIRQAHEAARAWAKNVGDVDGGEIEAYLVEIVRVLAIKHTELFDKDKPDLKSISALARTVQGLVSAQSAIDKRIEATRKRAAAAAASAAKKAGVKAETIKHIREQVMGI